MRLVDATVRGTASLSGARLATPDGYALLGDRCTSAASSTCGRVRCEGTLRMQNLEVGATLDCTGATLTRPRLRPDGTLRPSLDLRAATIGKDLCASRGSPRSGACGRGWPTCTSPSSSSTPRSAPRAAPATRSTSTASRPSTSSSSRPPRPPGPVRLAAARVGTFTDAEELWAAEGGVTIDGFDYQTIVDTRITDTRHATSPARTGDG